MTTNGPNPPAHPSGQEEPAAKPFYQRWWFITIAALVVLGVVASLFGDETEEALEAAATTTTTTTPEVPTTEADTTTTTEATTTTAQATSTVPETTTTTAPPTTTTTGQPEPEPAFGAGTHVVGEDIQPGVYETGILGEGIFDGCYWERLAGFSGEFDDIIANNNAVVHDVVEIAATDAGFSSGCEWYELTDLDEPLTVVPQGTWVIGAHIQPGTYQAEGGESCYWERLRGVSGEFGDIIANDLPAGSAIVTISASDYAFHSSGCGNWTIRG